MNVHTQALKSLRLKAKDQAYTLFAGNHLSKLQGHGYDFSLLREYQIGDEVRKIHWNSIAKLGKPYIKEFHSHKELFVAVCALMDGGLYFGKDNAKQQKLSEVAMILGYLVEYNADLFTGLAYTQADIRQSPTTKQRYPIEAFCTALFDLALLDTKLDTSLLVKDLFKRLSKPSLLFILGDFMEEIDLSILAQKHEIIAIIIRDAKEENPHLLGDFSLQSPQSSQKKEGYFGKRSIHYYLENFQAHEDKRQAHFQRHGIKSIKIFCGDSIVKKLQEGLKG